MKLKSIRSASKMAAQNTNIAVVESTALQSTKTEFKGSDEQVVIWDQMLDGGGGHLLVNAVAGSGKSTTALHGAKLLNASKPGLSKVYLVFGKDNQLDMEKKAEGAIEAVTYHSLGYRAIKQALGYVTVDKDKLWKTVCAMRAANKYSIEESAIRVGIKKLSSAAKQMGYDTVQDLKLLVDHHQMDFGKAEEEVIAAVPAVLLMSEEVDSKTGIDYDDMVWLPYRLSLGVTKFDFAISDESQDLNPVQQWMAATVAERVMVIGDRNQAIYGFRGSDTRSMDNLASQLIGTVKELPLSMTRRCPHAVVRLGQKIVPHLQALPSANEGVTSVRTVQDAFIDGGRIDMVICRVNAPLITTCYQLIAKGIKAHIKGKEIGAGILSLLNKAEMKTMADTLLEARTITEFEVARFMAMPDGRGESRADGAQDKLLCLIAAAQGCQTPNDLKNKLTVMFNQDGGGVVLGSIHKLKGLEANTVYVLAPEKMPHPMSKAKWQLEQEMNCIYVALTRSMNTLHFCGPIPKVLL